VLPLALKKLTLHVDYKQPVVRLATTTNVMQLSLHADHTAAVQRRRMILPRGIAVLTQGAADDQLKMREQEILAQQMPNLVAAQN
jgi:hypothetical protein